MWVDALEHAFDSAVLTRGVHALEDQQHRPAVLGVELFLEIGQALAVGIDDLLALLLVEAAPLGGLVRLEMKFAGAVVAERRDERLQLVRQRFRRLLAHATKCSGWGGPDAASGISAASRR